jgi:uncharacterized protein
LIVVSDASPLISLTAIGQLELLRELYEEVRIPAAVEREIAGPPDRPSIAVEAPWIVSAAVRDQILVRALGGTLDRGEAEAITLAVESKADLLLMDERRGRQAAKRVGLSVVGVLGVLLEAKAKGLVPEVRPLMDALLNQGGFRIGQALRDEVLRAAGEA